MSNPFELQCESYITGVMAADLAHDLDHVKRVVATAKLLAQCEGAQMEVVVPSAWLHDCFCYAKDHPQRHKSSIMAAYRAVEFLTSIAYPAQYLAAIHHAIAAHSYSAGIATESIEAQVVQDADRLDALGAIGIARCIQVSSQLQRPLYASDDPFCQRRPPQDKQFTLDHFYQKLLLLEKQMNTKSAQIEAERRTQFMHQFLAQLQQEV